MAYYVDDFGYVYFQSSRRKKVEGFLPKRYVHIPRFDNRGKLFLDVSAIYFPKGITPGRYRLIFEKIDEYEGLKNDTRTCNKKK